MTRVTLKHIGKRYDGAGEEAVRDLNLDIREGELIALLGPSGCGKTTTLKMIAGLLGISRGELLFNGRPMNRVKPERREAVMVYQNYLLFPYMNVEENIGFGLKMRRLPKKEIRKRVEEMLELVRLEGFGKRKPSQLSGGQKQRVALARALIIRPEVLLLDEPLSSLDAHLRDEMREMILQVHKRFGLTTIFVTHDQEEAVLLADRIALMFEGRLQQFSPPRDFYEKPATRRIAAFFGNTNCLPGRKRGDRVETAAGTFALPELPVPDGPVSLVIRPEAILPGGEGENSFSALVERRIYMGTHTRWILRLGERRWNILSDPSRFGGCREGEQARFRLPREKIWLLEGEADPVPS